MRNKPNTYRRLMLGGAAALLITLALCVTTYALFYVTVKVEENRFQTGVVSIDLNGGQPVITEDEYLFEPGMTVEKPFYIQNQSTWAVYYKLYLGNVEGGLADVLQITILDGDKVLYSGTASELSRQNVAAADDLLLVGQRKDLTIRFHFPENAGNEAQNRQLIFELCADAVQEKNNPDRLFE